ncbi:sulfite exporter TauE/SafE family protein 1-like [Phalaenopsis equestris]|uniref:sulfite exporter TauE/SafE family protein 1-like n=1 Tax=Phalaenopsis equestris TaxID=78828 RepID=UPI0009E26D80|nr:sulfite exporter TauE/SafE family protein 1-like [Phalaenopsis equestris]
MTNSIPPSKMMAPSQLPHLLNYLSQLRNTSQAAHESGSLFLHITSYILCFIAASISSAGGVGGGSLYLPILNLIAGMDLKSAAAFSSSMVTAGSVSSVLFNIFFLNKNSNSPSIIDYQIALLSQPSMLLGVSIGVVCNVMFPEWLITALFAIFLACSTYKICRAGRKCWKEESYHVVKELGVEEVEEPLLEGKEKKGIPWRSLMILFLIWVTFFVLHLLVGSKDGKSMIHIKPCRVAYWLITMFQLPTAIVFTLFILYIIRQKDEQGAERNKRVKDLPLLVFPLAAILSGIMGGLFGIGGGLLINPVLLQIGVPPQVTAGTTSFMVLFSSSMSLVQFLILGMKDIDQALIFSAICFIASIVGLVIIQRAIERSGRASLIVFSVSTVMALSTISISCFGAIDVWRDYTNGKNMGFRLPC